MRREVPIEEVVKAVNGSVIHNGQYTAVRWVVCSGLMSDVLTTTEDEILLVSNLNTSQVIRTADMIGAHAVLLVSGKPIPKDTIELAKELGITLISTQLAVFESSHNLSKLFFAE
jgi:hypothetical protein